MTECKALDIRNRMVRKGNDLIQKSRFDLSVQQQKILLYLISQIEPYDEDFKTYRFVISEFRRVCGISDSGKNYSDLKSAIKGIADKSLWVTMPDGKESLLRWIEKARIDGGAGTVEIRLDDDLKPFLLQLKENYTQYELIFTLNFKGKYAIRLYELVKSVHYHDLEAYTKRYSVDDLRRLMDCEQYTEYRDFKRRVLIPAITEINESSDKIVSLQEIRQGRKTVAIELVISSKDAMETLKIRDAIDKRMGIGEKTLYDELQELGYVPPDTQETGSTGEP